MPANPSPYQALILAAGIGSRLAPLTDTLPKSLVTVKGKPIIFRQIEALRDSQIHTITIVTGYQADQLKDCISRHFTDIRFLHSEDYIHTNNMVSAYLARNILEDAPLIMMNADVCFDPELIADLIDFPAPNAIVTQPGTYDEEAMKVTVKNGYITHISKNIKPEEALGNSMDVYKLSRTATQAFFNACQDFIQRQKQVGLWSEVAINAILPTVNFQPCPLTRRWCEIDTLEDLDTAEKMFQ